MKNLGKTIKNKLFNLNFVVSLLLSLGISGMSVNSSYGANLPRPQKPTPTLPHQQPINPSPKVNVGTRPHINPANINKLPDLIITHINPKLNPSLSKSCDKLIPKGTTVFKFDLTIKNIGRDKAIMKGSSLRTWSSSTPRAFAGGTGTYNALWSPEEILPNSSFHFNAMATNVNPVRLKDFAGKVINFNVQLLDGPTVHYNGRYPGLTESNYHNNSKKVKYRFRKDYCKASISNHGVGVPLPAGQTVKPHVKSFQFAGGKQCVSPGGILTINGSAFGNSSAGRTIELGGNGLNVKLEVKSWNNRIIRAQLPRNARLNYNKNYWVSINSKKDKNGISKHLSNLQRGIKLCPPTVKVGHSGTSGHQNGGNGQNITVNSGKPDLVIKQLSISKPTPNCFNRGILGGHPYYTLPTLNVNLKLHNNGRRNYSTVDSNTHQKLPVGIIGDRYVAPKQNHVSICLVPVAQMVFRNLNIPAGGEQTIHTKMQIMRCPFVGGKVVNQSGHISEQRLHELLNKNKSIKVGIGKAVFIRNKIPEESNYDNNFGRTRFTFPSHTCGDR